MSGTQRIGWDPVSNKVRSWVFDSEGGFAESLWTRQGDQWLVKLTGVSHDGWVGSATNVYTRLGPDKYSYQSRDRVQGNQIVDDTPEVIIVREPPEPGKAK